MTLVCLVLLAPALDAAAAVNCDTLPARRAVQFDSLGTYMYSGGNDCWGWVSPTGIEYGIYGATAGVSFVNIGTMQEDGFVGGASCIWRDIKTYQHYCYVVSECGSHGVMIIDMQYLPDSAHLVGEFTSGGLRSHNLNIDTARGFAYVLRQNYSGFRVLDLANPEVPVQVAWVSTGDIHDVYARNDTVWVAEGNNHEFSIWDMSVKSNPVELANVGVPAGGYVHNIWPTGDGRYVVTTEETPGKTVKIWDTSDLQNIQLVSSYLAPSQLAHNAHIVGNYLFLSHYESGVAVIDITYPECPVEVARFDTYPQREFSGYNGCWGVYPHAGTGHVYASNIDGKFTIFQTDVQAADFVGTPAIGDAPLTVNFSDLTSGTVLSRSWQFGDGDSSSVPDPVHEYQAGLYAVQLSVNTTIGPGLALKTNYITALAETLSVADTGNYAGAEVSWDISLSNHVPVTEITLPISLSSIPAYATLDSISRVGTRTEYFEFEQMVFNNIFLGELVVVLRPDNGGGAPSLSPGSGPIVRVYLTLKPDAPPGGTLALSLGGPVGGFALGAATVTTDFIPASAPGTMTVMASPCSCPCHGDPVCDSVTNVLDIISTVDVAFRGLPPTIDPACPHAGRTDVDCSQATDVIDVVHMVDVAFRGADQSLVFCDPCTGG